jgi:hypothetical protein
LKDKDEKIMNNSKIHEYKNDFIYFILTPYKRGENNTLLYCSAVDLYRFLPITKGRHRPMANPVMRGLQLVNLGVRALALKNGAIPKALKTDECAGILPVREGLYKERLLIEKAPESLPQEIINFCIPDLFSKISNSSLLDCNLPEALPEPDKLQEFIEDLCRKYGK